MSLLVKGGTVVGATGKQVADVLIEGEKIVAVLDPAYSQTVRADEVIDATGKYVIPGGIDAHTHMELPFG
ncbi:MAG TPA: amidohydrolase family protein, partial [Kribbella sp.]